MAEFGRVTLLSGGGFFQYLLLLLLWLLQSTLLVQFQLPSSVSFIHLLISFPGFLPQLHFQLILFWQFYLHLLFFIRLRVTSRKELIIQRFLYYVFAYIISYQYFLSCCFSGLNFLFHFPMVNLLLILFVHS